jgi:hypothetical protein
MALSPEQKRAAHERGLRRKAEREALEDSQKPMAVEMGSEYDRFRRVGLTHEEALQEIEKRRKAQDAYVGERGGGLGGSRDAIYTGPRGGRYRINGNGRKSYDVR